MVRYAQRTLQTRLGNLAVYAILVLFAFWLRLPHFTPLALIGSDGSEYVYCVQQGVLPHSPYVLHYWVGWLLNLVVPLDWGYSALTMVSSLVAIPLFGLAIETLGSSRPAGWISALVLAVTPVSIRFAGFQEVYAFQFLWLCLAWWGGICRKSGLLCGIGMGAAFATHSGTLFAIPATLLLFRQAWTKEAADRPDEPVAQPWSPWIQTFVGFAVPVGLATMWLLYIWLRYHGLGKMGLLFYFLRGAAPSPRIGMLFGHGALTYWGEQILRTWRDVSSHEVTGPVLLSMGAISLLLLPFKKSFPWWLLCLPYLLYEIAMGYSLDEGIYLIFIAPAIAAALGTNLAFLAANLRSPFAWLRGSASAAGVLAALLSLPAYQKTAEYRNLLPWIQRHSATMALCNWVRENTPPDTLVIQPVDWDPTGLSSTLYSGRTPLFNDGEILLAEPWKPLFTHPVFKHVRSITTNDFEEWIGKERPLVCFDADPFRSWGCYWPFVHLDRYETRPILWLDQNQSGTSRFWKNTQTLARIDVGNATEEKRYEVRYPVSANRGETEMWLFRPTLYRVARKTDPEEDPEWVRRLQERVPPEQRGAAPVLREDGVSFEDNGTGLSFQTPAIPDRDHVVRLLLNSGGDEYAVACQVQRGGKWVETDRDMEKIVVEPVMRFTDLYFRIPGRLVDKESLNVRFVPLMKTRYLNAFLVEVGAAE